MWRRLKALLIRLFARHSFTQPDGPYGPYDLDSRVREPRRRGPTGRTASVAVDEPEEEKRLLVFTHHQ
jgi:hypothetical protein